MTFQECGNRESCNCVSLKDNYNIVQGSRDRTVKKSGGCPMAGNKPELIPLTPEEQSRAYAEYYRDPEPPDPVHLAMMDTQCDPSMAIYPEQMNDLLNPGDLRMEVGWCNLPNGAGFIANRNVYKNVTPEMIDWWWVNMEKA